MVRGPAAFTISFMTRADSQPWQVRCPDVKYSSSGDLLDALEGQQRPASSFVERRGVTPWSPLSYYSRTPSQ